MKFIILFIQILLGIVIIIYSTLNAQDIPKIDSSKYTIIEQMPQYPEGDEARIKFLNENLIYPEDARIKGIEGRVYVTFIVEKDGSIRNVELIKGIGVGCDEEAIRMIKTMPNWEPGIQLDKPVRVQFNMSILFKLNGKSNTLPAGPVYTKDVNFSKGVKNMDQGYYYTASKSFSKSIKRNDLKMKESYAKRALCFYKLEKIDEALSDMEIASSFNDFTINRTIALLYLDMGNDAMRVNDLDQALNYYNKGLEADRGNTDLLFQRGKLHLQLNNSIDACKDFTRASYLGSADAEVLLNKNCSK